ncbi:MAG: tRNA pseudouridine(38-40) synthase TruA [Bacteroidales bacterium]|nr:tRNA pseudouridine(38-40) synthase TruA [Bacteroidales bacterium]
MRYFIEMSYNGTPFFGWQVQPEQPSVQGVMERALTLLLREPIAVTGCGRTDTGVHARQFFAHFDFVQLFDNEQLVELADKLNSFLPKEISICRIFLVSDDFHARFSAKSRTYKYYVAVQKEAFRFHYSYRVFQKLDVDKMNAAAKLLLDTEDFTSFSKLHTQTATNICHVSEAHWQMENGLLVFTITADRFLRNMVRAIVGTLLDVGRGKMELTQFQGVINQKNRCAAGTSVPANALFLQKVEYVF